MSFAEGNSRPRKTSANQKSSEWFSDGSRDLSLLFQHYKKSIHDSFEQHPNANFLVILEEDLDVSVDILSYFKQLLPVLENDESVYCISAWNDQVRHLQNIH